MQKFFMKSIVFMFLVFSIFSCKKNDNIVSSLFLESLIESSDFYKNESDKVLAIIEYKNKDYMIVSERFESLKLIDEELNVLFKNIHFEDNQQLIEIVNRKITEINLLKSEYKFKELNTQKLKTLNQKTLYYYLKSQLYKDFYQKCNNHLVRIQEYCGYKVLSNKQMELIRIIQNSNIK